jgi:Glyceraldehyde-3-phosphate dehydrogenase/erythrose-4-phosphate dehydrogenase
MKENKSLDDSEIDSHIKSYILDPLDKVDQHRPSKPKDIVLYGFGRIGRLVSRIMAQMTGPGNYYRLRAIVVRKGSDTNDLLSRASLLGRDSVHGSFPGPIRVAAEAGTLVIDGHPVQFIYAYGPPDFFYSDYGLAVPIVIVITGVWGGGLDLSLHLDSGASFVVLTAPGEGPIQYIVNGISTDVLNDSDPLFSAASCATLPIVPVLDFLNTVYSITSGHVATVHAYSTGRVLSDFFLVGDRGGSSAALLLVIPSPGAV